MAPAREPSSKKPVSVRARRVTVSAGVVGGGFLANLGLSLKEPWRSIVVGIAPAATTAWNVYSPRLMAATGQWVIETFQRVKGRLDKRAALRAADKQLKAAQKELERQNLSPEEKEHLVGHVSDLRTRIVRAKFDGKVVVDLERMTTPPPLGAHRPAVSGGAGPGQTIRQGRRSPIMLSGPVAARAERDDGPDGGTDAPCDTDEESDITDLEKKDR